MKPLPDFTPYFDSAQPLPGEPIPGRKYRRVESETYHAWPALSAGLLKEPTAAHMLHHLRDDTETSMDAKTVGTLVHWATLEPDKIRNIHDLVVLCPTKGLDTKAANEMRALNPGKLVLGAEHILQAIALRHAIEAHHEAHQLLSVPSEKECSGFLFEDGIWRKWRPDFLPHDHSFMGDVKSTRVTLAGDYGRRCWVSECWANGYFQQAAWYLHHHEMLTGMRVPRWIWIAVSKDAPYHCRVFKMENLSPQNPLYGESMICKARQVLGLDGANRITAFHEAATRTASAVATGTPLTEQDLRRLWEACENEPEGPEIGLPHTLS